MGLYDSDFGGSCSIFDDNTCDYGSCNFDDTTQTYICCDNSGLSTYNQCIGQPCSSPTDCVSGICDLICKSPLDTTSYTTIAIVVPLLVFGGLLLLFGLCQVCYRMSRNKHMTEKEKKFRKHYEERR